MKNNIFQEEAVNIVIERINKLTENTKAHWGKMNSAQMLTHCNVAYEMHYEHTHKKPNFLVGFMLKLFVKSIVTSGKAYKKNNRTAPQMLITENKDFEIEKRRLIAYIEKVKELGESYFDGKESFSFGNLNKEEWNNLFYKHLDHHLTQFGV